MQEVVGKNKREFQDFKENNQNNKLITQENKLNKHKITIIYKIKMIKKMAYSNIIK